MYPPFVPLLALAAALGGLAGCGDNHDGTPVTFEEPLAPVAPRASTMGVVPIVLDGNTSCAQLNANNEAFPTITSDFGWKKDNAPFNGTFTLTDDDGVMTGGAPGDPDHSVTLVSADGIWFDWTATLGMDAVIVKGGPDGQAYVYYPEAMGDRNLSAPLNPDNGTPYGISHIEFCYDYELTATKTAEAEYTMSYEWSIEKLVDVNSHTGFPGSTFTSNYTVNVTRLAQESDHKVTGEIHVTNPTPFPVTFAVADAAGDPPAPATVTCPTYTAPPGETVICAYEAPVGGAIDGLNVATITSQTPGVDGTTAEAAYVFGEPTTVNGFGEVNVSDYFDGAVTGQPLGVANQASTSFSFPQTFACPTGLEEYTDGVYTKTFPNQARILETEQTADQSVDVNCYALVVAKDAATSWVREYTWEIDKSVTPPAVSGFPGDAFDFTYAIELTRNVVDRDFTVYGQVHVTNPAPEAVTVLVSDNVGGTPATLDCGGSLLVPAGATASCGYSVAVPDPTAGTNEAVVSFQGASYPVSAPYVFGEMPTSVVGFETVNVDDTNGGSWNFTGSGAVSYVMTEECSRNPGDYQNGTYTRMVPNTATITETSQSDNASRTLTCNTPALARVAKTTTYGPESIGQVPLVFQLVDPNGAVVSTLDLPETGGAVVFPHQIKVEGLWTVRELLPAGWMANGPTECAFNVTFPFYPPVHLCSFDDVEKSRLDLVKLTNGQPTTLQTWSFALYGGTGGYGGQTVATDNTPPSLLDFGPVDLDPTGSYTLCELGVPAGYTSFWQVDTDGDQVGDVTVIPYNPNATDDPPEDLGNRCIEVGAGTDLPLLPGTTLHVVVDNQMPGGDPRTPGYWKNWNTCTGGGQAATALANGGYEDGFWLLENVLDPNVTTGVIWDDIQSDAFLYPINQCAQAVDILDKRMVGDPAVVADGKKNASDPLVNLATALLAAQLNFGAGACTTQDALDWALEAETLLDTYNYEGGVHDALKKNDPAAARANVLATLLDDYNNGEYCGSTMP